MKRTKSCVSVVFLMAMCSIVCLPPMKAKTAQQPVEGLARRPVELATGDSKTTEMENKKVLDSYSRLPLYFIKNNGQLDEKVSFYVKTSDQTLYFTDEGIVFDLIRTQDENRHGTEVLMKDKASTLTETEGTTANRETERLVYTLLLENADKGVIISGEHKQEGRVNYFVGNDRSKWKTNIPTYKGVIYKGIYKGIDLKTYGNGKALEYEFVVKPGADPKCILLSYEGIEGLSISEKGELVIKTIFGVLKEGKPYVYQVIDGKKVELEGRFGLKNVSSEPATRSFAYGFELASYNPSYSLIIDPILYYSTYLGGSAYDGGFAITVDAHGSAYVTGDTYSTDFPTEIPFQGDKANPFFSLAFVTKLNMLGTALEYSTYFGGTAHTCGRDIQVDGDGKAYVVGFTYSQDFPTQNPYQANQGGARDVFVSKFNAFGNALEYSTYLGGSSEEMGEGVAVDGDGKAYVVGYTSSGDFPMQNPYQASLGGGHDVFVSKFNAFGNALEYSTYLGGNSEDWGDKIAVDSDGKAYVTGYTYSSDFPTQNPYQTDLGGGRDGFVTKFDASGTALEYSTYLGGADFEGGEDIVVDGDGKAYVTGATGSADFPTQNAYQTDHHGGDADGFVTKFNASGSGLEYSTFLGGTEGDNIYGITVDGDGKAYVAGYTLSTDFPTVDPCQGVHGGGMTDAFVAKLSASGSALEYSTFLGGSAKEWGHGVAVDEYGNTYVVGRTQSTDFPTQNPFQASHAGDTDVFVAKLGPDNSQWAKTYGGSNIDYVEYADPMRLTGDGGCVVAGITLSFGAESYDMWILKLDFRGDVVWEKIWRSGGVDVAWSVQQTSDGGYIVGGETPGVYQRYWLLKLNPEGGVIWEKTYDGSGSEQVKSIQQTDDGGFVVVGDSYSFSAGLQDFWVLKLDSEGGVVWESSYGGGHNDNPCSVQQTSDGGYVVAGGTHSFDRDNYDFWILKLDSDGDVAWEKVFGGNDFDIARSIQQTTEGGYVVAGEAKSFGAGGTEGWVLTLDASGDVVWQKNYGSGGFSSVHETVDSGYIVSGGSRVVKLNALGEVVWGKGYYGVVNSVQPASDGGYVLAGSTTSFGAGSRDIWVLKVNSDGEIPGCAAMYAINVTGTNTFISGENTNAVVQNSSASVSSTNISPQDSSAGTSVICSFTGTCTDTDGDGYGVCPDCGIGNGCTYDGDDCDDGDDEIYPGAFEGCDGKINDCNDLGAADGSDEAWYGDPTACGVGECASTGILDCVGGVQADTCTPGSPPEDPEVSCSDGLDNDCDGFTDGADPDCVFCADGDSDGYGVCPDCGIAMGCTFDGDDCNDGDDTIYPGATEVQCDGIDQDCDGADYCPCPDTDGDGVCDDSDNCPSTPNPSQEDSDGDGLGNVCDTCPNDPNNDADGDGICGDVDPDDDGDDLPDVWELYYGLDPLDATGVNGKGGDFDSDTWTNYDEYIGGTDPTDPNSTPPIPAHRSTWYGVNRSGVENPTGNCAHCHEAFNSPVCGQHNFMVFYDDWVDNSDMLCLECHSESTDPQQVHNNPYSVNFGGYSPAYYTTIETQFCDPDSTPANGGSRHDLDVIRDVIDNDANGWGFGSDADPCVACHSPHAAQRNYPVVIDGEGKLNTAIRRPSHYKSTDPTDSLWGDDTGERMNSYAGQFTDGVYQAPYYADTSGTKYEPTGSSTNYSGSHTPDYVTFCMDCHQNAIGDIPALDWDNNPHGGKMSSTSALNAPYTDPNKNYVISCLDCHEPHGAKQEPYLFRRMVNGQEIPFGGSICVACHDMGETSVSEASLKFGVRVHQ